MGIINFNYITAMKKVKYLTLLFAASMFAACSDSLDDNKTGNGGTTPTTGNGYVKVAINLPTNSGMSRVDDGTMFDDGLDNEYAVTDGIIAFFKASSTSIDPDADATFVKAYDLGTLTQQDDQTDPQVSTRVTTTTEAPLIGTNEQLYALVILNPNVNVVSVDQSGTLKIGSTNLSSTSKLVSLQDKLEDQTLSYYAGTKFLMTNAPLSTVVGNSGNLTTATAKTLVPVTVYETKTAAEADEDPARIYVERVVAKVTLSGFTYDNNEYTKIATVSTTDQDGDDESVYNGDIIELTGWTLNVTNKSTKLVRDVTEFSNWLVTTDNPQAARFVGTSAIAMASNKSYYRIYWAVDGNYTASTTTPDDDFTTYTSSTEEGAINWNTEAEHSTVSNPLYCFENTMDYGEQKENRTTSVLLKTEYRVKFSSDETPSARDFFICGTTPTKYPAADITGTNIIKGIITYVKETAFSGITAPDLQLKSDATGGYYDSADDMKTLFKIGESTELSDDQAKTIWNKIGIIKYYKGGVSYYYATLIRHFSDLETPWDASAPTYALKHLGRYGVVRNNWYDINITSISGPGDPEITTPSEDPDDQAEGYVRAEINVLSWAKRSQDVEL